MTDFLPFAIPDIGEEEIFEVVDTLRSGWITTGQKTRVFEKSFAEFLGCDLQAVSVNSATAGLHLALEAIGISAGDQVITTPYTFTATAEVVRYLQADPVFVDIDPDTMNIDPSRIESAINERTKAIIPVHFGGTACDMDAILHIAKKFKLKVVEDAAHALPTTYRGKLVGSLDSDVTVFSFYATKTITTGEGGMLVTRNTEIADRCRTMRLHGISRDAFDRYQSRIPSWFYEVVSPGFKYNMTDIAASLGIHQLKKAWVFQKKRAEMAARYDDAFKDLPVLLPPRGLASDVHAWHLYVIRLTDGTKIDRDVFVDLLAKKGIGSSVHFIPLHIQPYWRDRYGLKREDYSHSYNVYRQSVSLPLYTRMTDMDQERVISAVKDILE